MLIVDEVQHALSCANGSEMLFAQGRARCDQRPPDYADPFLFIGTGSHRSLAA
jgi:hypothetical protein